MIYLLLLAVSFFTHWQWMSNIDILTSGDWIYQDPEMLKEFYAIPSIWTSNALGAINIGISFAPFNFFYSLLSHWGIGYGLSERIVFLWPILIALPLCSYFLIKKNIKSTLAAVIGSLVYTYNTYFGIMQTGHMTLLAAYAFIPLVILLYQKTLESKDVRYALATSLAGFIVSFYEFRAFYILCFVLFFYFIFYITQVEKIKSRKNFMTIAMVAGLPFLIDVLLNLYWLLPLANTGSLVSNTAFNRTLFGNEFLNILQAFTLHHPFWTGAKTAIFEVYIIPIYFWFIPIFAFLGFYLNRRNKYVLFFGFIALLGIFLTKQVGQPFADVYPWLFQQFPGFNAFREASKFFLLIALGYAVLIAAFIDWSWTNWKGTGSIKYIKYFVTIFIAVLFLWNAKPFVTTEVATMFVPRQMPTDYATYKNFISKQDEYFRTFWVPAFSRWSFYTNNHPEISAVNAMNAEWYNYTANQRNDKITEAELIIKLLQMPQADKLLDMASIKYVIIPVEDKANDDNFFVDYKKPRSYYIKELDTLSYLKKVDVGTKEIIVYENENYRQHIYTTEEKETIKNKSKQDKVKLFSMSPTEYRIVLSHVTDPLYLHFTENYHPDWRLRNGEVSWRSVITDSSYFLSNEDHFKNDAMFNSYRIDPKKVCSDDAACIKNEDGSYDINLTIYFRPQAYVYLGGIISIITLITIVTYFLYSNKKKNDK